MDYSSASSGSYKEGKTSESGKKSSPVFEEPYDIQDAKSLLKRSGIESVVHWLSTKWDPDENASSSPKLKKSIIRAEGKPFLYIRDGDFDIVWTNVAIFTVACLLHAYSIYVIFSSWTTPVLRTWICCQFFFVTFSVLSSQISAALFCH